MNDPTKPIPIPLHSDLPARRRGESERLAISAGSVETIPGVPIRTSAQAYGINAAIERRGYRRTSRAKERAELIYLAERGSWSEFVEAVDRIVGDL